MTEINDMESMRPTQEQRNKLITMCKALYPAYKFSWSGNCANTLDIYRDEERGFIYMHWFEFAFTKIAHKIFYRQNLSAAETEQKMRPFSLGILSGTIHPIDYLYEEFLMIDSDEDLWDDIFRIINNPDRSSGTKEAYIREKYNSPTKKH